ncbi:MAG: UDP-N-acetylmuramoyl-L-alanine--D-glutamate ligase [Eubacteriales bacterium]|nr:UDP-N-acetylmuramoyl-L-alanine--D-glutamate ligase [Eubacteriales bacterium]
MKKYDLGDVCVLGCGMTGKAVAEYLSPMVGERVHQLTLYTGSGEADAVLLDRLKKAGAKVVRGDKVTGHYDLCVASPGIPCWSEFYRNAVECSDEFISEPELAYRENSRKWIGVTGTSGKTTVVSILNSILRRAGVGAVPAGNEWYPIVSDEAARNNDEWMIAELSHSQLINAPTLHPRVAIITNVSEDHQDWHRSMDSYANAKEHIFDNLQKDDLAIVCSDDIYCRRILKHLIDAGKKVCVIGHADCGRDCAAFVENDRLIVRQDGVRHELLRSQELQLPGECNRIDALAAAAAAVFLGVKDEDINAQLRAFKPFSHRNVYCGEVNGIQFVDNAKSGNPAKAEAAVRMYRPGELVLIAGGRDAGMDVTDFAMTVAKTCTGAVIFGPVGERYANAFREAAKHEGSVLKAIAQADTLEEAFRISVKMASP